jgi:hypothetical protein
MAGASQFDRVRALARDFPDVIEGTAYGSPALRVGGKMFACIAVNKSAEPDTLAVRMSSTERDFRLRGEPEKYYLTPHYEGYHVILARLGELSDDELRDLLEVGYNFERAKRKR